MNTYEIQYTYWIPESASMKIAAHNEREAREQLFQIVEEEFSGDVEDIEIDRIILAGSY